MTSRTAELRVRVTSDTSGAAKSVDSVGSKVAGFAKKAAKAGGLIAAGLGAAVLWKGFQRLSAIDDAEGKLRGLGYSAKQVEKIMSNALDSVKGTAFGLGDAATVAASTVAAGVKPGKDLTRTLSLVGDAATIAGTDFASMGAIFNKVAASNKIQGDTIAQLSDQGIPIIKLLSKELGVSAEKVTDLASKGKIDFATFQDAMEAGLGGAAQESGKTFTGALQNVGAAMGRLGAQLLGGVFSQLPALFGSLIGWIDKLGPVATKVGNVVGKAFARIGSAVAELAQSDLVRGLIDAMVEFGRAIGRAAKTAGPPLKTIGKLLAPLAGAVVVGAIVALSAAFKLLGPVIETAAKGFAALVKVAGNPVFQALAVVLAAMFAPAIAQIAIFNAQMAIAVARVIAVSAAQKAAAIATKLWAAAQWVLNAAMNANVIGLIVIAIVALIAIIVILWKRCATFRAIVTGAFAAAVTAAHAVGRAFVAIGHAAQTVFAWIKGHWRLLAAILFGPVGIAVGVITKHWGQIRSGVSALLSYVKSAFRAAFAAVVAVVRAYVSTVKTVITGIRTAVGHVITAVGNLIAKFRDLKLPGALKSAIDAVKSAIDRVVTAVGNLISKLNSIPTPHINWPSPPKWFSKLTGTAMLPPVPGGGGGGVASPTVGTLGASRATLSGGGGPTVQINVTGALDPEAVARQIKRIMGGHNVRMGVA